MLVMAAVSAETAALVPVGMLGRGELLVILEMWELVVMVRQILLMTLLGFRVLGVAAEVVQAVAGVPTLVVLLVALVYWVKEPLGLEEQILQLH
jgi:hypothetical protein